MLITKKTHTRVNMNHKHHTLFDRNKIEVLRDEGYSFRSITKSLGFHHSTISENLKDVKTLMKLHKQIKTININHR